MNKKRQGKKEHEKRDNFDSLITVAAGLSLIFIDIQLYHVWALFVPSTKMLLKTRKCFKVANMWIRKVTKQQYNNASSSYIMRGRLRSQVQYSMESLLVLAGQIKLDVNITKPASTNLCICGCFSFYMCQRNKIESKDRERVRKRTWNKNCKFFR